jgi:hypothetical protein
MPHSEKDGLRRPQEDAIVIDDADRNLDRSLTGSVNAAMMTMILVTSSSSDSYSDDGIYRSFGLTKMTTGKSR